MGADAEEPARRREPAARPPRPPELGPRFAAVAGRPPGWTPATALLGPLFGEHIRQVGLARGARPYGEDPE